MNTEGSLQKGQREVAEYLFDGDKEKAQKLLTLIQSFTLSVVSPELYRNLQMNIPEPMYSCQWCTDQGECWFYMLDSRFCCEGKCKEYKIKKEV